ncbi:MAG TPA: NAD-dependent epimerase/dehydratase family protein, partial [Gemmatimonadales bacterium]|nr:NAD-dependent epimerase/dehydratase family protein [Gemmatimonadales bacterium]
MRIFIAGATGVVGRRLIPMARAAGHMVTAVGRTPEKRALLGRLGANAAPVDLVDPVSIGRAVAGHEAVINLATHIPRSSARMMLPGAWRENDRLRGISSGLLAEAATTAGAERLIQESFALTYADQGTSWVTEESPLQPVRYNRTVLDAETAAARFARNGGIGIVLRFAAFYGPNDPLFTEVIQSIRWGRLPYPGAPEAFISFVSHEDAATATLAALTLPSGVYNVVDDEPLSRHDAGVTLAGLLGVRPPRP